MKKPKEKTDAEKKKDVVTRGNLEECIKNVFMDNVRRLNALEKRLEFTGRKIENRLVGMNIVKNVLEEKFAEQAKLISGMEDIFFTLYHNIRKNQFLYSSNPEAWLKETTEQIEKTKGEGEC